MNDPQIDRAVVSAKSLQHKKQIAEAQRELKLPEHALKTECPQGGDQGRPWQKESWSSRGQFLIFCSMTERSDTQSPTGRIETFCRPTTKLSVLLTEFTDALSGKMHASVSWSQSSTFQMLHPEREEWWVWPNLHHQDQTPDEKYSDPLIQELLDMAFALEPQFKLSYISDDNVVTIQARPEGEDCSSIHSSTVSNYCDYIQNLS